MKKPFALLLCAILLLTGLGVTASAVPDFFFAAIDYEILPLEPASTPLLSGGRVYAPVEVFAAALHVSVSDTGRIVTLSAPGLRLDFDVDAGVAFDWEKQYNYKALRRNGLTYLPVDPVCEYFSTALSSVVLDTDYGSLLRLRVKSAASTDQNFLYAARSILKERVDAYNAAQSVPGGPSATPSPAAPSATPPPTRPIAYLSFDDGPTSVYSGRILDILDTYGVKATFFLLGSNLSNNEPAVRRMIGSGHAVGLHSYTHEASLVYASPAALIDEMTRCNDRLEEITLLRTRLVRLPYGSGGNKVFTEAMCQALTDAGYRFWDWNVDGDNATGKYARKTAAAISAGVISDLQSADVAGRPAIILLHEREKTVEALPAILEYMTQQNYIFLVCTPSERPYNHRSWIK